MIYFLNENTNLANVNLKEDVVLEKYELDLHNNFSIDFAGSYPLNEVVDFPGNGFYYSDYGFKDNYEVYYIEASKDELRFYEVFIHSQEED